MFKNKHTKHHMKYHSKALLEEKIVDPEIVFTVESGVEFTVESGVESGVVSTILKKPEIVPLIPLQWFEYAKDKGMIIID